MADQQPINCPNCNEPPTRHYYHDITYLKCGTCGLSSPGIRWKGNGISSPDPTPEASSIANWNRMIEEMNAK